MRKKFAGSSSFFFICGPGHHIVYQTKRGNLFGIGRNKEGELSLGDFENRLSLTEISFFDPSCRCVKRAAVGFHHTVFLTKKGVVYTTGSNVEGQLSITGYVGEKIGQDCINIATPIVTESKNEKFVKVFTGTMSTFLLTRAGEVLVAGGNNEGNLGIGRLVDGSVEPEHVRIARKIKTLKNIVDIEVGGYGSPFTFFLNKYGRVWSCGNNFGGRAGLDVLVHHDHLVLTPTEVTFFSERKMKVRSIHATSQAALFQIEDGSVYGVGQRKLFGAVDEMLEFLGPGLEEEDSENEYASFPVHLDHLKNADMCSGGDRFFVYVKKEDGIRRAYGLGYNGFGFSQFGASNGFHKRPVQLKGEGQSPFSPRIMENIIQVVTSGSCTFVICKSGEKQRIWTVGYNPNGILMHGHRNNLKKFTEVKNIEFDLMVLKDEGANSSYVEKKERIEFLILKYELFSSIVMFVKVI